MLKLAHGAYDQSFQRQTACTAPTGVSCVEILLLLGLEVYKQMPKVIAHGLGRSGPVWKIYTMFRTGLRSVQPFLYSEAA